ncbi:3-phosphoshikimate 1-carboxyvinyltransferase [Candidimonas sp. SYP-B2681]|uniref:3-phosphoshikimate 1-carboxyvinyltransferase n=1 Tax=Candidimonas sp. SYP-B2681 TaxID=2497686 RepID=UPI000F88E7AD|nr:3-phosphoshikimate 1-carboxyvinyltransferase [Candidimonas sp. SYP-B2681]RTZ40988.1 3-phosphoshikimate 1-carboxyvinyltransferase [Candidimonas sp. SYP-B2681]
MTVSSDLCLEPVSVAAGQVDLPGSKSISNRVLLLAALATGTTQLDGLLDSDDTRVMLAALRQLGVPVTDTGATKVQVQGGSPFMVKQADIFLGNAGTAFRPLTAALALMGGDYRLSGVARMHERPIGDLVDALIALGADIQYQGSTGYPPLLIQPGVIGARAPVKVKGSVSSQFLTALLLAAPIQTAGAAEDLIIDVEGELISKPYILITLNLMAQFGVQVQRQDWHRFIVPAGSHYQSPGSIHIEGDASTASYFMALGAIGGGPIHIHGAGSQSIQGDMAFADVIESMGATVVRHPESIEVGGVRVSQGQKLKSFDRDFNLIPDAAMTAATLALYADGPCTLRNIGSWRVKETDRIHAMHTELSKLGAKVESGPDWIRVYPVEPSQWRAASIETYDDHRMAMCFSLAAFGPVPITILDPDCVSKTFPDYFSVFQGLVHA